MDKKTTILQAACLRLAVLFTLLIFWSTPSIGQCDFSCQDHVYLSLDESCEREVTVGEVMTDVTGCENAVVMIFDDYGNNLGNYLRREHRGKKLTYKVTDESANSCWGYITVEDKMAPIIECADDTVNCWEAIELLDPTLEDNCWDVAYFEQSHLVWVDYECENDTFVGYYERDVITQDLWGNTSRCYGQRLYILRENLDSLVCPEELVEIECCTQREISGEMVDALWDPRFVYEDEDGYSHPIPGPGLLVEPPYLLDRGGRHYLSPEGNTKGKCNIVTEYKDHIVPTCASTYKIRREWKLFDWCTGEDTICVQWIKITDTIAPKIKGNGMKEICLNDPSHLWYNIDAAFDCDVVQAYDITPLDGGCVAPRTFYVKPHDCVSHVTLARPEIIEECALKFAKGDPAIELAELAKIKVTYQLQYFDKGHPGTIVTHTGDIAYGEEVDLYLPAGWFQVFYFVKDECWNESYACEYIVVEDNVAPIPVCDEITQVTLDPDSCWTRVPAEVLDDGSHDNCSQNLHFAVANMDTIEYYRNYWHEQLQACMDPDFYHYESEFVNELIEKWINCFVFQDYIDLSECGTEMLVLRVYEADGMPLYDPHLFKGTEHEWFCFNLYDDYACFYKYHYDEFTKYSKPTIDLCDYKYEIYTGSTCEEGGIVKHHPIVVDPYCNCNPLLQTEGSCITCERDGRMLINHANPYSHGPTVNRSCCKYESSSATSAEAAKWLELTTKYPALSVLDCKRFKFQHLYNDCMIEVIKDDKTPPVCIAPSDVSYYCDGLPVKSSFFPLNGNDEVIWTSAQFAHDICYTRDTLLTGCEFDRTDDAPSVYTAPNERWCVDIPWDGGVHGYYGGPTNSYYFKPCDEQYVAWYEEGQWSDPIYCRFWLMLDKYDDLDSGKPDPDQYFGEPTVEENCWTYTDTSYIEGSLDECGVGILTKTWIISDKCGNTSSCYQNVYIKPRSDFEVKFPADLEFNCNDGDDLRLEPIRGTELYPEITDDECELIGVTYKDQVLGEGDGCYKILRTWKVIDWCVYDPDLHTRYPDVIVDDRMIAGDDRPCVIRSLKDDGDGFITYLQVIKVIDDENPVVTCIPDTTICSFDVDCGVVFVDIELGTAEDNCTPADEISYRYTIIPDYATDERDYLFGHGNSIRQPLPTGVHQVILYAMDDCKNIDSCSLTLELKDCKPPTPYCYDGIATVVMPMTGSVEVWASDLDAGTTDNCTAQEDLIVSFDPDGEMLARTFTCEDIRDGIAEEIEVEVYFTDEDGNTDFCRVTLVVQDNSGDGCPDTTPSILNDQKEYEKTLKDKDVDRGKQSQFTQDDNRATGIVVLNQNRPNPYQNETIISFEMAELSYAKISIMDVNGKILFSNTGTYQKGYHELKISKSSLNVTSGLLYYQLETAGEVYTKKMVVIE